jgi:hypothetical protein
MRSAPTNPGRQHQLLSVGPLLHRPIRFVQARAVSSRTRTGKEHDEQEQEQELELDLELERHCAFPSSSEITLYWLMSWSRFWSRFRVTVCTFTRATMFARLATATRSRLTR